MKKDSALDLVLTIINPPFVFVFMPNFSLAVTLYHLLFFFVNIFLGNKNIFVYFGYIMLYIFVKMI